MSKYNIDAKIETYLPPHLGGTAVPGRVVNKWDEKVPKGVGLEGFYTNQMASVLQLAQDGVTITEWDRVALRFATERDGPTEEGESHGNWAEKPQNRSSATPNDIVGLDIDEDGNPLSLMDLKRRQREAIQNRAPRSSTMVPVAEPSDGVFEEA